MAAAAAACVVASSGSKRQYDRLDPFTYMTDVEFQRHFRLSKTSVRWLCDELGEDSRLRRQRGGLHSLTVEEQVLCALRFYGTGSFQGSVGTERYIGRHQSTVSRCVRDVSDALIDAAVRKRWLAFPKTAAEREYIKERFLHRGNITNVVGCVDGTYVGIKAPSRSNPDRVKANYFTRKAHYALNAMVVCDADLRILDIDARFPGSCHDAHVWGKSAFRRHFQLELLIEDGDCLLGKYFFPKWLDPLLRTHGGLQRTLQCCA
ncbi:putative nuclease HARBI1 [Dermacentor silvarum]|uniref:putative nuclease HARBI1 n=1 Tax=Dermacentor silvarum TaxID=543639 RepID=UPI001897EC56|nr:putative nuclease HARBI1 [Dermacentor silvarum]